VENSLKYSKRRKERERKGRGKEGRERDRGWKEGRNK
jgi:hypothetical protein